MPQTETFHNPGLQRRVLVLAVTALFTATIGCGDPGDQPDLGIVTGTVTLDGAPLTGVAVTFAPSDGRPAMGTTDDDGLYQLIYIRDTPGCKVGLNRVQIGNTEESAEAAEMEFFEQEGDELVQDPTKTKVVNIPSRYNTKTELQADVQPGENVFDFSLTSGS